MQTIYNYNYKPINPYAAMPYTYRAGGKAAFQHFGMVELKTKKPKYLMRPNDKVSNRILCPDTETDKNRKKFFENVFEQDITLDTVTNLGGRVSIRLTSECEDRTPFRRFDGLVYDAVCSIVCNPEYDGQGYMTAQMIYETMRQSDGKISEEMRERIDASLEKMASTRIKIDYTEEFDFFDGLPDEPKYTLKGSLLHMDSLETQIKLNGKIVDKCYKIYAVPILYRYALAKNQVCTTAFDRIETQEQKTIDILFIKDYLLRRIYAMKGKNKKLSHTIKLDSLCTSILKELDYTDLTKEQEATQRKKIRQKSEKVLKDFVDCHFITGYKVNRKGRKVHGFTITLPPDGNANKG